MDRGVKASELIRLLQDLISQHGDLDVFKERNGSARPIYFAEYYQQENHFEFLRFCHRIPFFVPFLALFAVLKIEFEEYPIGLDHL